MDEIFAWEITPEEQRKRNQEAEKVSKGNIYCLKKKQSKWFFSKFYKVFVFVYSEPDNSEKVSDFLSRYVNRRKLKQGKDSGLVIREFE